MYKSEKIKITRSSRAELKRFCDLVGLVVLDAVDAQDEAYAEDNGITFIVESTVGSAPVGCCRIDDFTEDGARCTLSYYMCKEYIYDETCFSEMLFSVLKWIFGSYDVKKIVCTHVKKMFGRQHFFPESGFVVEILQGCVNPNGELLVQEEYVMYREEFDKRYGDR